MKRIYSQERLKKDRNGCGYVFTYNSCPVKKGKFNDAWNKAVKDAGFDYKFHDLGTTGITIMGHNGEVGFKTTQDIAGHIDPKTTQGYMKSDWEKQKEAAKTLALNSKNPSKEK